jgi:hypothetical protein
LRFMDHAGGPYREPPRRTRRLRFHPKFMNLPQ